MSDLMRILMSFSGTDISQENVSMFWYFLFPINEHSANRFNLLNKGIIFYLPFVYKSLVINKYGEDTILT